MNEDHLSPHGRSLLNRRSFLGQAGMSMGAMVEQGPPVRRKMFFVHCGFVFTLNAREWQPGSGLNS
ncbi:MAG: hypothetical protein AAGG44_16200, partial [Planctomycetota bacterium]